MVTSSQVLYLGESQLPLCENYLERLPRENREVLRPPAQDKDVSRTTVPMNLQITSALANVLTTTSERPWLRIYQFTAPQFLTNRTGFVSSP